MRKFFYAIVACALIALPFTSCSDDDDDKPFIPTEQVTNLSFVDTDKEVFLIGGTLSWTLPASEENISGYVIYLSESPTAKGAKLGEVEKGATSFAVPDGTEINAYLHVVAKNSLGESEKTASIAVKDVLPELGPIVFNNGLFILNGGNYNANNASISFFDFSTGQMKTDIYQNINGSGLGDSAEEALVYGSKVYVAVTTSNRLVVLTKDGRELTSYTPTRNGEPMNPRGMVAKDGKIYISYFYGHEVAVLDTASLTIENTIPVGRYPEKLAAANGKIYVTNSGGLDHPNYGNTVSVIDPETMTVEDEIEVLINPGSIVADSEGDLYVVSLGNYVDVKNTLQRIDKTTGEVSTICNASKIALANDKIYLMYAQWGVETPEFKIYDTLTEEIIEDNFIKDGTTITSPNAITVDPVTEKIYITYYDYMSTASLYIFGKDGKLEGSPIDTGGYDSKWMFVMND
ncbi:hypothetical protein LJC57_03925 [Parabacteroides sp. OttesenSCG-928-G07]|nr:hypothetical protein [Parabacteroides sp. OttesenSCG-928-G21]MDL2277719.1 hypothetical protein [Parabacteroides sp. OttesenSCG-928-G07]